MNSVWACFVTGLMLGLLLAGFVVYKVEEDRILTIEAQQQKAIIAAQDKVIQKQAEGNAITQRVSQEYENKIAALNAAIAARKLQKRPVNRVSGVSKPPAGTNGSCPLAKIELSSLQEWITEQIAGFNHP